DYAVEAAADFGDDLHQTPGDGAAVGVAQAQDAGAGFVSGFQGAQRVVRIGGVAIEEVLGVVDDFLAVFAEIGYGVGDENEVLFQGNAERAMNVEVPRLPKNRDDRSAGVHQGKNVAVLLHGVLREPGGAERSQLRVMELEVLGAREEI